MKLNKILIALAATAMVGCSSDDVMEFSANQVPEDSRMIELNENFVLAGVGAEGNITRTHWEQDATTKALVNKFLPIWATVPAGGNMIYDGGLTSTDADLEAQAVGLCWLGQGAVGTDVYTNYQFYHWGWLNNGETEANFECGELMNGATYDEISVAANALNAVGSEAIPADFTLPAKSTTAGLNYNSGVYKTDNKAIFGGQYIVYYPFNEDFKDAGTIPATAETSFRWDVGLYKPVLATGPNPWEAPQLGDATFRYSAPVTIEGGDQAADFGLYNLSTLVRLRVACPTGDANIGDNIDQVVLYSPSKKLLKQANLAADKIVAGKKGAALYAETEGVKTITTNFVTTATALSVKANTTVSAYITVLPTTVDDLVALVHNATDKTWAAIDMGNTVFEAGKGKTLDVTVTAADFKSDFIAVDEASLTTAIGEARAAITLDPAATPEITVIGDITLEAAAPNGITVTTPGIYSITNVADANITIQGDAIIVPEDITLRVKTNVASDVRVLGKSCCSGTKGGVLSVFGGTISNVTMEPTKAKVTTPALYDTYNPTLIYQAVGTTATIAAGKTIDVQAGNVIVRNAVEHKGALNIAEGAKLTVDGTGTNKGDLNFMGSTVVNDGTIEVLKGGKYDMTDADGNATATDGQRMTNNGKFIHNVDAGVGTAVQSMHQNGEYRCKVDEQIKLDDAFLQWTACSVIEMVNAAAESYNLGTFGSAATLDIKHNNKYIDFEVNSGGLTTFYNPASSGKGDNKIINIGNLTVTAGGLDIDYVTGTSSTNVGRRTLKVNGDMAVAAATTITDSKEISITGNLTVEGVQLTYKGGKQFGELSNQKLAVTKNISVSGGTFAAAGTAVGDVDALNITCVNFSLASGATAIFANRTDGGAKNLVASGTISNPAGCTFNIVPAGQNGAGSVLAWVLY